MKISMTSVYKDYKVEIKNGTGGKNEVFIGL